MEEEAKHPYPLGTIVTTTNNDGHTVVGRIVEVHEAPNLEYHNDEGVPSLEYLDPIYYTIEYWDKVLVTADALGPESMTIPNTAPDGAMLVGFRSVKRSDIQPPQWIGKGGGSSGDGDEGAPVRGPSAEHGTSSSWLSRPGEEELDTLSLIKKYGLSVRQIPRAVVSVFDMLHFREGDAVVKRRVNRKVDEEWVEVEADYCQRTEIPENAGYWMCQQVPNIGSSVQWKSPDDFLAPTLEESVQLFVQAYKAWEEEEKKCTEPPWLWDRKRSAFSPISSGEQRDR